MIKLGYSIDDNRPVTLTLDERRQGTYIIGTTGAGKTTLLKNIIIQDMRNDREHGLCVLDPHGDLTDELLGLVPEDRINDVILFNPMDMEYPFGLNLLDCDRDDPHQVRWVISTVMGTLRRLFYYSWGPLLEHVLRNVLLTTMKLPDSTLLEVVGLLNSTNQERERITSTIDDHFLRKFWETFPTRPKDQRELVSSTLNKLSPFVTDVTMRNIVGQQENTIDLRKIMDEGKILFINLSKGDLGEENSALLGSVIVNLVLIAALQRRSIPVKKRRAFHLIVDEFQNFATESFAILQSEARKYAVDVVVAHQYRDQLDDLNRGSTLNVGNTIVFRVVGRDGYELASQFDNTPPQADSRVEPIYQYYEFQGVEALIETQLNTGEGKLYQEVELPRRPYSDVQAEMANKLSNFPDWEARCRLIRRRDGKRPRMEECQIVTENLDEMLEKDEKLTEVKRKEISGKIKLNSRNLAKHRTVVERDIERRAREGIVPIDILPPEEPLDT